MNRNHFGDRLRAFKPIIYLSLERFVAEQKIDRPTGVHPYGSCIVTCCTCNKIQDLLTGSFPSVFIRAPIVKCILPKVDDIQKDEQVVTER